MVLARVWEERIPWRGRAGASRVPALVVQTLLLMFSRASRAANLETQPSSRYREKILQTRAASFGLGMSLRAPRSYPRGTGPPIHIPFFFEAAILSRIRSPVTSRSNWANDRRILSVRSPMDVVVLNC